MRFAKHRGAGRLAWLACWLVAWTGVMTARPLAAQAPAVVRIQPATLSLAPGETAGLAVSVEEGSEIFGFEMSLTFDPAVLQVVDADPGRTGVQVQSGEYLDTSQGFVVVNGADNEAGRVDYAMTLLAPAEPVSGGGDLLRLMVRAVAPGNSPLTVSIVLASQAGLRLPAEAIPGTLAVIDGQPSAPSTPSPLPSLATPSPDSPQEATESPPPGSPANLPTSAPDALVQTAVAVQATSRESQTSTSLRPTGPASTAVAGVAEPVRAAGEPEVMTGDAPPAGASVEIEDGPSPPSSDSPGVDEEPGAVEVAAESRPITIGSEPASVDKETDSAGTGWTTVVRVMGLVLACAAAAFLGRRFLGQGRGRS